MRLRPRARAGVDTRPRRLERRAPLPGFERPAARVRSRPPTPPHQPEDRPHPAPRAASAWLLPLAAFALLAWRFDFLCDDAFISFRYSRHLAEGHGLRYNLGAAPPVEGYSNFLWVVWLGALHRLGLDITLWARLTSFACGALLVSWLTRFARRRLELHGLGAAAVGLFLATLPPVALWATGGLATTPVTLCVFGCYERLFGEPGRPRGAQAAVFAALAASVRADGAAWVVTISGRWVHSASSGTMVLIQAAIPARARPRARAAWTASAGMRSRSSATKGRATR